MHPVPRCARPSHRRQRGDRKNRAIRTTDCRRIAWRCFGHRMLGAAKVSGEFPGPHTTSGAVCRTRGAGPAKLVVPSPPFAGGLRRASSSRWRLAPVPSHRQVVNPVRPGREQRQRRTRVPRCGWCGSPPFRSWMAGRRWDEPPGPTNPVRALTRVRPADTGIVSPSLRDVLKFAGLFRDCTSDTAVSCRDEVTPGSRYPRIDASSFEKADTIQSIVCIVVAGRFERRQACAIPSSALRETH